MAMVRTPQPGAWHRWRCQLADLDWTGGPDRPVHDHAFLMHPTDPQTLFCAATTASWKTRERAADWTVAKAVSVTCGGPVTFIRLRHRPVPPQHGRWGNLTLMASRPARLNHALAVSPDDPGVVYVLAGGGRFRVQGLYRSTNSGLPVLLLRF